MPSKALRIYAVEIKKHEFWWKIRNRTFLELRQKLYETTKNNQLHIDQIDRNVMYGKGPSLSGEDNDHNIQLRFKKNNS